MTPSSTSGSGRRHNRIGRVRSTRAKVVYAAPTRERRANKLANQYDMNEIESLKEMKPEDRTFEQDKLLASYLAETVKLRLRRRAKDLNELAEKVEKIVRPVKDIRKEQAKKGPRLSAVSRSVLDVMKERKGVCTGKNIVRLPRLPFVRDNDSIAVGDLIKTKEAYKSNASFCSVRDEKTFVAAENLLREQIFLDKELRDYMKRTFSPHIDEDLLVHQTQRVRLFLGNGRMTHDTDPIVHSKVTLDYAKKEEYCPSRSRIKILSNITRNRIDPIAVFSDVPGETLRSLVIPDTLVYTYADRNELPEHSYPGLTEFIKEAESKENIIKCSCCSGNGAPIVPCWQNPDCACYQMNAKLQVLQAQSNKNFPKTNFSTFEPILIPPRSDFYDTIGFACSERCGCHGRCTNNVTLLPEKKIFITELFRVDANMGFGVRSMAAIPAGTPIMEFTGRLRRRDDLDEKDESYAFDVVVGNEEMARFVPELGGWSDDFKKKLKKILRIPWCVNPREYGNVGRTCCHSCVPNLRFVRVFQKGFLPTHARLLLVTMIDIFPGVELTLDYGESYAEEQLKTCLCKEIVCKQNPHFDQFKQLSKDGFRQFYALKHHNQYKRFENKVLNSPDLKSFQ
ncbi:unnamed protein product [Caenorhabditis sp. 36 PRJEB53466]|nr:unnamed protein product [Caenorhabditis sp. 36 PRJEB53466]